MNNSRIIVSLDYPDPLQAMELANKLDPGCCKLKVGKELFTRSGPEFVKKLVHSGFPVFLDLKFHDIPNTVAAACTAATELGIWMLNVHASGGMKMISAAREAIDKASHKPLLIAVTVLTSLADDDLAVVGVNGSVKQQVLRLARISSDSGADGVVCSAQEVAMLRQEISPSFCLVTPGIRPRGAEANDQIRIVTPSDAIESGSDYLVIGRPITQARDPLQALLSIEQEVNAALLKVRKPAAGTLNP